jgi:hypothetical protein
VQHIASAFSFDRGLRGLDLDLFAFLFKSSHNAPQVSFISSLHALCDNQLNHSAVALFCTESVNSSVFVHMVESEVNAVFCHIGKL